MKRTPCLRRKAKNFLVKVGLLFYTETKKKLQTYTYSTRSLLTLSRQIGIYTLMQSCSSRQDLTNHSSFLLVYGCQPRLPIEFNTKPDESYGMNVNVVKVSMFLNVQYFIIILSPPHPAPSAVTDTSPQPSVDGNQAKSTKEKLVTSGMCNM